MQDTSSTERDSTMPVGGFAHPVTDLMVRNWPPETWREVHVLLAVSGGADSTALLRAVLEWKHQVGGRGKIHVAHVNHGLRGAAAEDDEKWVTGLCDHLQITVWIKRVEIAQADAREGWEAAARDARYQFLTETAEQIGARYVATAHTADDQVETVLHRILRGTGIDGLTGIPAQRQLSSSVLLVRPILQVARAEVLDYLRILQQDFRTDETNDSTTFTRNWIRNEMLPAIRKRLNPDVDQALLRLSQQANEFRDTISERVDRLFEEAALVARSEAGGESPEVRIQVGPLANESPFLVREVCKRAWQQAGWPLRDMGFRQWQQLAAMILAEDRNPIVLPGRVRAEVSDSVLSLRNPR